MFARVSIHGIRNNEYTKKGSIYLANLTILRWTENNLKTELFENDDVTIIM